jgi:hypothetical protein
VQIDLSLNRQPGDGGRILGHTFGSFDSFAYICINQTETEMKNKRMTGIDYRREWHLIKQSEKSLKAHSQQRLNELMKKYPDAKILESTAKELVDKKIDVTELSLHTIITYIEIIEKWSADQQKIEQLYIEMPDELKSTLKRLKD